MRRSEKTAVFLTTYPLAVPRHGGQIRSGQIVRALRGMGLDVVTVGIADENGYAADQLGPHDVVFPNDSSFRLVEGARAAYANDYLSGLYAAEDGQAYRRISTSLPSRIDMLFLEQPWMLPVAQKLRCDWNVPLLVYGSQNDETALKAPILRKYHREVADALLGAISACEQAACREADLVFAVNASDQAAIKNRCGTIALLAPNGVEPWQATERDLQRWREAFAKDAPNYALYVASAHPPNFVDFFDVFGDRFGCLAPNEAVCIVGGAAQQIEKLLIGREYEDLSRSRLRFLGVLDATDLAAIKQLAQAFVLPILDGSGSNLKTAEALFSGKWVVGTPTAFRGFESFTAMPHAIVADPGKNFCSALRHAMSSPSPTLSDQDRQRLLDLTWERTLAPMISALSSRMGLDRAAQEADASPIEPAASTG